MRALISLLLAPLLTAQAPTPAQAPADSPITWRSSVAACAVSPVTAAELSRRYLGGSGLQEGDARLVEITDRDELGSPVRDRTAYLTFFRSIQLERPPRSGSVQIDLYVAVDAATGALLLAFSPAKETWTAREAARRSADTEAAAMGWTLAATSKAMSSTIVDVLNAVFASYGPNRFDVGQIVVRPRWVDQKYPARQEGEKLVPIRPPANAWLVHAMGGFLGYKYPPPATDGTVGAAYYWTEVLMLVADSTLVLCPCGYMP